MCYECNNYSNSYFVNYVVYSQLNFCIAKLKFKFRNVSEPALYETISSMGQLCKIKISIQT